MDLIHVTQDSDQGRALVNMEMNVRVSYNVGNFLNSLATFNYRSLTPNRFSYLISNIA
jgi:hypothetical protein